MARSTLCVLAISLLVLPPALLPAASSSQDGDAIALFRDEIVDAPLRIRWKETSLSEETRFAVAASGLSWRPSWNDRPLIITQKNKRLSFDEAPERLAAFSDSRRQRANKIAFAYALSLVLDPPDGDPLAWKTAYDFMRAYGADFDRALVGVLASPDRLPLLYEYRHAAADVLVYRSSPRLLPIFLGLSGSDDRYLRSRGVAALGVVAYRSQRGLEPTIRGLRPEPRESGISAVQTSMIEEVVEKATEDRDYRVRAAAALALGMMGGDESRKTLQKLLKDRDYTLPVIGDRNSVAISFPVRAQAARSLERWGERGINDGSGLYDARTAGKATRGARNITKDAREAAKSVLHSVRFHNGDW